MEKVKTFCKKALSVMTSCLYWVGVALVVALVAVAGFVAFAGLVVAMMAGIIAVRFGIPALIIWAGFEYVVGDLLVATFPTVASATFHPTFWQVLLGVLMWRALISVLFRFNRSDEQSPLMRDLTRSIDRARKATKRRRRVVAVG